MVEWQYLVIVRHGQSEANKGLEKTPCGLFYSLCGSDPGVPLTEDGLRQADTVGLLLSGMFPRRRPLRRVFENRYLRVSQTADRIIAALGYPLERETVSGFEKRNYGRFWNLTRRGVRELYPLEWLQYQRDGELHYRPPDGGENYIDVFERVDTTISSRIQPCAENQLVVTSSIVALAFRRRFEGISDSEVLRMYEETAVANAEMLVYRRLPGSCWERCAAQTLVA